MYVPTTLPRARSLSFARRYRNDDERANVFPRTRARPSFRLAVVNFSLPRTPARGLTSRRRFCQRRAVFIVYSPSTLLLLLPDEQHNGGTAKAHEFARTFGELPASRGIVVISASAKRRRYSTVSIPKRFYTHSPAYECTWLVFPDT